MPEGDTIRRLAERINGRFAGQRCQRCVTRDPRLVGLDLAGATLIGADAHGKHLLIRFDDGRTLYAHLRIDGSFVVGPAARVPEWRRRVELWMEDGRLTGVDVPILGVVATANEASVVGHLGPDLCGPDLPDLGSVVARMVDSPEEPLAGALLDQRNVAGFGNVYAVELPFIVGVVAAPADRHDRRARRPHRAGRSRDPHQRRARAAEHDRPPAARRRPLDLRPPGPALPIVWHRARRPRRSGERLGPSDRVVPAVSGAGAATDGRPRPRPTAPRPAPRPPPADVPAA